MASNFDKFQKRRLISSYFSVVLSVFLVLFLLGILGFFIINSKKLADDFKEEIAMTVFFKNEANDTILKAFGKELKTASFAKSFVYVWDASDGGELKADLVGLARNLNLDTVMFQSVDGDYQLITCAEGSVVSKRSLGKEAFGVLNGHFYKVAAGRPFELDDLVGLSFERINHVKENFIC